jgi:hypothetical protein
LSSPQKTCKLYGVFPKRIPKGGKVMKKVIIASLVLVFALSISSGAYAGSSCGAGGYSASKGSGAAKASAETSKDTAKTGAKATKGTAVSPASKGVAK